VAFPGSCEVRLAQNADITVPADRERVWFAQLISAIAWLSSLYDDTQFVFRGLPRIGWTLQSHLWRFSHATDEAELRSAEKRILSEVARDFWFNREFEFDPAVDDWMTLAVLQHHGIPTRLVDVTSDPLVGLYFTAAGVNDAAEHDDFDGALYMIRRPAEGGAFLPYSVRAAPQTTPRVTAQRSLFLTPTRTRSRASTRNANLIREAHRNPGTGEVAIDAVAVNCKGASTVVTGFSALTQRFLAGTRTGRPSRYSPNIVRFVIPSVLKPVCRNGLRGMGISARNLFPGIDGYRRGMLVEGDR
jgi:FRG domain-containing protein